MADKIKENFNAMVKESKNATKYSKSTDEASVEIGRAHV